MAKTILLVFLGSGAGGVVRYLLSLAFENTLQPYRFPIATLASNVMAAFVLGIFLSWMAGQPQGMSPLRYLVAIGFCGGLSTMSTFTAETISLSQSNFYLAGLNLVFNLALSLLAFKVGSACIG